MSDDLPDSTTGNRALFDAILHPHRSLGRHGMIWLFGIVITANLMIAGLFIAQGAWPVAPFCGLEVLILYLALRANNRAARLQERVRLTASQLTVERLAFRRPPRHWTLSPNWLRIGLDNPPKPDSPLVLSSHGQSVAIGSFLTPQEKLDFARALEEALRRWRLGEKP